MAESVPLRIERCGAIAREILADDGEMEVIALFARSFYVACPRGIVCIGTPEIGAGPVNVEVTLPDSATWPALGVTMEERGHAAGSRITIGDGLLIDRASGSTWLPPPLPPFDPGKVRAAIAALDTLAAPLLPDDGLAALIFRRGGRLSATARAAKPTLETLRAALPGALAQDRWDRDALGAAILLIGLGPGFTPSGDDLLGGLMLALTAAGRIGLRDNLWHVLQPELHDLTSPPSAMHLSAAADGMGAETIHLLLNDLLLGGAALPARLASAVAKGHTSGWDAVAGLAMGLDALTRA